MAFRPEKSSATASQKTPSITQLLRAPEAWPDPPVSRPYFRLGLLSMVDVWWQMDQSSEEARKWFRRCAWRDYAYWCPGGPGAGNMTPAGDFGAMTGATLW